MKRIFLAFILCLIPALAIAQNETDSVKIHKMSDVIVNSTRLGAPMKLNPSATSIVTSDVVKSMSKSISADEALRLVPGVRIDNQANGSRLHLSIRGQGILSEHGIRGIEILLDGIPLNDPSGFAPDFYDVDWETVSSIEVLRGPAASIYGGGANGGVINIETEDGTGGKEMDVKLFEGYGENGFWKTFLQLSGAQNDVSWRVSGSRMMGDGWRQHSSYWANNFSGKINWKANEKLNIMTTVRWTDFFNENPEGLNLAQMAKDPTLPNDDAIPKNEYMKTGRFTGGFVANYNFDEHNALALTAYLKKTDYKEPGSKYIWHRSFTTPGISGQYKTDFNISEVKNYLSVGVDYQSQTIDEYIVNNLGAAQEDTILNANQFIFQNTTGVFFLDRLDLGSGFGAAISLRYDEMNNKLTDKKTGDLDVSGEQNFNRFTSRLGVIYNILNNLSVFANWGQGFLPPATEELESNPANPGGFNMTLEPATSNGMELGLRGTLSDNLYYDFTGFFLNTKNDFNRYRIAGRPLETFYRNLGETQRMGIEVSSVYSPIEHLSIQLAYTYSNFQYSAPDSMKDRNLANSPEHQLDFEISYVPVEHLTVAVGGDIQSEWWIDPVSFPGLTQEGFQLLNARISYDLKISDYSATISIFGKNLSDQKWAAFTEPDPDGNSYQPGAGREFFGTLSIRF